MAGEISADGWVRREITMWDYLFYYFIVYSSGKSSVCRVWYKFGSDFRIWWIYEKIGSATEIHDQLQGGSDFQEKQTHSETKPDPVFKFEKSESDCGSDFVGLSDV